jgi:hypothetical protein
LEAVSSRHDITAVIDAKREALSQEEAQLV